jgi:hypothetical protein
VYPFIPFLATLGWPLALNCLKKWHEKTKEKSNSSLNNPIYHFRSPNNDQRPSCPKLSDPQKNSVSTHALRKGYYPRQKKMVRNSFRNRIPLQAMRQLDELLGRPIYFPLVGRDWFFGIFMFPSCFQWFPMMVPTCSSSSQCTLQIIFTSFSSSQCVPHDVPNSIALYAIFW